MERRRRGEEKKKRKENAKGDGGLGVPVRFGSLVSRSMGSDDDDDDP